MKAFVMTTCASDNNQTEVHLLPSLVRASPKSAILQTNPRVSDILLVHMTLEHLRSP